MSRAEPTTEMRQEYETAQKRLARLQQMTANTPPRRQNWHLKSEIEVIKANLASMERRYRFD